MDIIISMIIAEFKFVINSKNIKLSKPQKTNSKCASDQLFNRVNPRSEKKNYRQCLIHDN